MSIRRLASTKITKSYECNYIKELGKTIKQNSGEQVQ